MKPNGRHCSFLGGHSREGEASLFWGDPLFRASISVCSSRWVRSSSTRSRSNRTTLGYEVRAVGHNPEAARYGGISVARNYFLAMAIAGLFAGLAGALTSSDGSSVVDTTRSRARRSASSASPSHFSAATLPSASDSPPPVRRAPDGNSVAQPRSCVLPARSRVESGDHHPGADRSLRRADSSSCWRCRRLRRKRRSEDHLVRRLPHGMASDRRLDPASSSGLSRPRRAATDRGAKSGRARSSSGSLRSRSASARGSGVSAGSAATRSRPACSGS